MPNQDVRLDQYARDLVNQDIRQLPISPEILQRFGGGMQPQITPSLQPYAQGIPQPMQQAQPVQDQAQQMQPDPIRMQYNQMVQQRFAELAEMVGGVGNIVKGNRFDQFMKAAQDDVEMLYGKVPEPQKPIRVTEIDGTRIAAGGDLRAPVVLPTPIEKQAEELGLKKSILDLKKAEQDLNLTQQKAQTEGFDRALKLQTSLANSARAISMIDGLLSDPDLASGVGFKSALSIIPETKAKELKSKIDQIKGDVFLQAFEKLKGGGAITEIEGKKAEQSMQRLDPALGVDDFKKALLELRNTYMDFTGRAATGLQGFAPQDQQQAAPQAQTQQQMPDFPPSPQRQPDGLPIIPVEPPTAGQPIQPMSIPSPSGLQFIRDPQTGKLIIKR